MKFVVRVDNEERAVEVDRENGIYNVSIDGKAMRVDGVAFGDTGYLSLLIDNQSYLIETAPVNAREGRYYARVMGRHYDLDVLDELLLAVRDAEKVAEHTGPYIVLAPMPGLIVDIRVKPGDTVAAGDTVVIMEAMKMQNELVSDAAGRVTAVHVNARDAVESRTPLVVIERSDA